MYRDEMLWNARRRTPLIASFTGEDELPHQAALRCLRSELSVTPRESALITGDKPDGELSASGHAGIFQR